jgi:DNA-directed RNA polymerase sigma subunit (sigma70/sigma32)
MQAADFWPLATKAAPFISCLGGARARDPTLEEVGQRFSFTRECIRQTEAKARRELKRPSASRGAGEAIQ